jgi:hypothetical protein
MDVGGERLGLRRRCGSGGGRCIGWAKYYRWGWGKVGGGQGLYPLRHLGDGGGVRGPTELSEVYRRVGTQPA